MLQTLKILEPDQQIIDQLSNILGLSPIIARILVNRGITTREEVDQFINGSLNTLYDPFRMGGMNEAVELIQKHLDQGSRFLIHGDYDADGVTSTAIMKKALERLGVEVDCYIPDRFDEGYGFSPDAIEMAKNLGVNIIVTVDCGSSNRDEVAQAREAGLDIIITDHHEVPAEYPPANAFVNLKKPGEEYPFHELSGAGVALKLVSALYSRMGRKDWTDFLDLAAIGTVADVVPLIGENRVIVREGLKLLDLRKRPGVAKLLELSNVRRPKLSPWDISFIIAPRINAAGRLADATAALNLLLEEDSEKAMEMAMSLFSLNQERQQVEAQIKGQIEEIINGDPELLSQPVWVFASRGWHQGVIGIVASRFSQSFNRPVYLVSIDEKGTGRASARCSENYNIYKALQGASDLLIHYGGHRFAGGFSIKEENVEKFRQIVSDPKYFCQEDNPTNVDMILDKDLITLDLARSLEKLSPYGEGNPRPLFLTRQVKFQSVCAVGSRKQHLKFWVSTNNSDVKGIAFGKGEMEDGILNHDLYYDILYNLEVDQWNDQEEASIKVHEILPPDRNCLRIISGLEEVAIDEKSDGPRNWKIVDARPVINRRKYINSLHRAGRHCLILTRNRRQMEVLVQNLKKEGIDSVGAQWLEDPRPDCGAVVVLPFEKARGEHIFEDVIFYHPPYDWDYFQNELFCNPSLARVHLLFGDPDVMREEANQEILSPDRDRLLKIYGILRKLNSASGRALIKPNRVAGSIKDDLIHGVTVRVALKVFSEIGLLQVQEQEDTMEVGFTNNDKQDLTNSPTFIRQSRKKENFTKLKKLYMEPFLNEFKNNLHKIINKQREE